MEVRISAAALAKAKNQYGKLDGVARATQKRALRNGGEEAMREGEKRKRRR